MQGFYLHRNGEWLAPECVTYGDTDARYHNVVLIDGEGHYRPITDYDAFIDTMAESRAYLNASGSLGRRAFLSSDGTNRFRNIGDVAKWTRDVLYLRPATLVVVDDIESGSSHALEWICHLNADATNTLDGSWAKSVTPEGQAFGVFTAVPSGASTSLGVTLHPEAGYPDQPRVSVSTTGSDVRYAHALHATTNAEWNAKPTITTLADVDAGLALRILRGDVETDAIVPDLPDTTGITIGDYALDGEAATVSRDGADNVVGYFLAEGTTLSQTSATTTFVRADAAPIWIDVELAGTAAIVAYDGGAAPVTIHAPDATTLTVNGETTPFTRDGDAIVFNAPNDAPDRSTLPECPELKPAFPNPFNPTTTVAFSLPRAGEIELAAFNALGERVATLYAGYKMPGDHEATFDASDLPSGVYLIRLCAASFSAAQKVILIK